METLLAEQPLVVSLMLSAVSAALLFGWLQTGNRQAAIAGLVFACLIPAAWLIADRWETDREQIESLIVRIADAVERNDIEAAVQIIGDPATKGRARMELRQYEFHTAQVNKIRSIDVIQGTVPIEADVDMSVRVDVSHRAGQFHNVRVLRRLLLRFQKSDDDWVVIEYRHMPLVGPADQYSSFPKQP